MDQREFVVLTGAALAAELVALKPDIIVATGTPSSGAAMKAASIVPIVFVGAADPVGTGLVASLARPGGNVTGTSILSVDITGKSLEILHEVSPGAKRLAYLANTSSKASALVFHQLEKNASMCRDSSSVRLRADEVIESHFQNP